jgi:ABC-type transport system involved in multi-copper enzyme maturation permease subunit
MNKLLSRFIQIVVFLFAAFGGFFNEIAPPTQTNPKMVVGFGSFLVLIILLIISAIARNSSEARSNKKWILAGCIFFVVAVLSGVLYPWTLSKLTYYYPPPPHAANLWRVKGLELTQTAKDFIDREPGNYSPAQLEVNLNYEDIWTERS